MFESYRNNVETIPSGCYLDGSDPILALLPFLPLFSVFHGHFLGDGMCRLLPGFWKLSFTPHCKSFVVWNYCLNMTPLLHSPFQLVNKLIFVITLNGDFCWILQVCWLWLVISHEVRAAECSFLTHDWVPLRLCYPSEWVSSRNDGSDTIVIQFSVAGLLGYESLSGSWEG